MRAREHNGVYLHTVGVLTSLFFSSPPGKLAAAFVKNKVLQNALCTHYLEKEKFFFFPMPCLHRAVTPSHCRKALSQSWKTLLTLFQWKVSCLYNSCRVYIPNRYFPHSLYYRRASGYLTKPLPTAQRRPFRIAVSAALHLYHTYHRGPTETANKVAPPRFITKCSPM